MKDPRIQKIVNAFEQNGWLLKGSADVQGDWWFEDIFHLVSVWSPVGVDLYLTLLVDPQINEEKVVLEIGISTIIPIRGINPYISHISLNDVKRINLKDFVKRVRTLLPE